MGTCGGGVTWPRVTRWHAHIWAPINICGRVPAQPSQPSPAQPRVSHWLAGTGAHALGSPHQLLGADTGLASHCRQGHGGLASVTVTCEEELQRRTMWTQGVLPPNTAWTMSVLVTGSVPLQPVRGRVSMQTVYRGWHWADTSIDLIENTMCGVSCNYPAQPSPALPSPAQPG